MWIWMLSMMATALPLDDLDWRVVNDTVMGGMSQSRVDVQETMVFTGVLSLERNGGFASTRARVRRGTFDDATAVRMRVRGDGRSYDLTLRRGDVPLRAGSYRVRIATSPGQTEVEVPLAAFRPTSFGRPVPGAPALDAAPELIDTIGIMLADKKPGPFALEVVGLTIVRADRDTTDRAPAIQALAQAIDTGVPLFNAGRIEACRDVYQAALEQVLASNRLTAGEQSIVDEALNDSAQLSAERGAWALRHAMDTVLYTGA